MGQEKRLHRSALTEQVYERLKALIVDGTLAPGQRLTIDALAREWHLSNIPIREALARLAAEKLVDGVPFKGYTVPPILAGAQLVQLFAARVLIEGHAARVGAATCPPDLLTQMETLTQGMAQAPVGSHYHEFLPFNRADARFHQLIVASGGNDVLSELYTGMHAHLHLSRIYAQRGAVDAAEANTEHAAILRAFATRDAAAAEAAVIAHLEGAQARLSLWLTNTIPVHP